MSKPLSPVERQQIEEAVEGLLAILDAADGDPDLEANGDLEPSLGGRSMLLFTGEIIEDGELDNVDYEYSLGWGFHIGAHGAANIVNLGDHEGDGPAVS